MNKQNSIKIEHFISQFEGNTNEVLVLSPLDIQIKANILFFHGHQIGSRLGAWETPRYLATLIRSGYQIIAPSILGYGGTTGTPDYCGPATLNAIYESVKYFTKDPIHVMGASRGGTLAVLFSEKYPQMTLSCTAIAGAYDLKKLLETTEDTYLKQNLLNEIGSDAEGFDIRDARNNWQNIKMPIHIIHGENDTQIPKEQAEDFASFLTENGVQVKLSIIKEAGHKLFSEKIIQNTIIPFLTILQK